jgi:replicative DNA helicase
MSSDLLVKRIIASVSSVNLKNINTCRFYGNQRPKVADAMNQIMNLPIYIDESPGIRLMDIVAKTRKLQATNKDLGLVIIDYLGLIQATSGKSSPDSRQEEVRKISLEIKNMARELKVPVVLLSQLSRDVEKRDTKRPMISDLRDSGSIEQDADVIFLLYRDDYYADQRKKAPGDKKPGQMSASDKFEVLKNQKKELMSDATLGGASYVEVHVAKNRNGSTGTVPLFFYKEWGKFEQPSQSWIDEMERLNQEISGE